MRTVEAEAASWARGAVVQIPASGTGAIYRPALFVFEEEGGGLAWVEPSYLDPFGASSPALHRITKVEDVTPAGAELVFFRGQGSGWDAIVYPSTDEDDEAVREALAWGLRQLESMGTSWERERARLLVTLSAP